MVLKIKKLHPDATMPKYLRPGDAAMDLYSNENKVLQPNQRELISTGIAMAIPQGNVGLIWDRSGMAANHGIKCMGGVIDSNYRGELKVILHNLTNQQFTIEKGMRIAQMLIQQVEQKEILEVKELDDSIRGEKGFGSSGMK
ncbi:MAG: dUTP diphosphatase [Nanoarchaeota archaeon]|nr:dUTP diphosphatase [Nanoarchaeota archaeon]